MPQALEPDAMVRELYAREQIRQVKWNNLRCLDTKRWDEIAATFHPDCTTGSSRSSTATTRRSYTSGYGRGTGNYWTQFKIGPY